MTSQPAVLNEDITSETANTKHLLYAVLVCCFFFVFSQSCSLTLFAPLPRATEDKAIETENTHFDTPTKRRMTKKRHKNIIQGKAKQKLHTTAIILNI